jgi:hypothetical protein
VSVELEVRMGSAVVAARVLVDEVSRMLAELFPGVPTASLGPVGDSSEVIGGTSAVARVVLNEAAEVEVLCHSAGNEAALGVDGGWWATVSVVVRSPQSVLLLAITAASLARLAGAAIVDASAILRIGHHFAAETVFSLVGASMGSSFEEAAEVLARHRRSQGAR